VPFFRIHHFFFLRAAKFFGRLTPQFRLSFWFRMQAAGLFLDLWRDSSPDHAWGQGPGLRRQKHTSKCPETAVSILTQLLLYCSNMFRIVKSINQYTTLARVLCQWLVTLIMRCAILFSSVSFSNSPCFCSLFFLPGSNKFWCQCHAWAQVAAHRESFHALHDFTRRPHDSSWGPMPAVPSVILTEWELFVLV
jgi:hypothetical protein